MSRKNPRSITNNPNTQNKKIKQEFALLLEELRLWMWFISTMKKFSKQRRCCCCVCNKWDDTKKHSWHHVWHKQDLLHQKLRWWHSYTSSRKPPILHVFFWVCTGCPRWMKKCNCSLDTSGLDYELFKGGGEKISFAFLCSW
jgi:hypothetical protein